MLRVHDLALDLVREVAPLAVAIGREDADLAKQLRRAMSSVPLNIAEGTDQRGARRTSHYSIALGSAREAWSALRTGAAWGYVPEPPQHVKARFDHLIGALYILSHAGR